MGFWQQLFGAGSETQKGTGKASTVNALAALVADMHSHALPGLDDGVEDIPASLALLRELRQLGYRKLIMTPHIMGDFYKNTPEGVRAALARVREAVAQDEELRDMELDCAAEYYLDEWFIRKMEDKQELLTFGGEARYILLETSYINESRVLGEAVFLLKAAGYQPVLAHPERYQYLYGRFEELEKLREKGLLLQLNLNSLVGYYSDAARHVAEQLVDKGLVDFVGTDAHGLKHAAALRKVATSPYLRKLLKLPLRNASL